MAGRRHVRGARGATAQTFPVEALLARRRPALRRGSEERLERAVGGHALVADEGIVDRARDEELFVAVEERRARLATRVPHQRHVGGRATRTEDPLALEPRA